MIPLGNIFRNYFLFVTNIPARAGPVILRAPEERKNSVRLRGAGPIYEIRL